MSTDTPRSQADAMNELRVKVERENTRLREEVNGLLQDIQRLTEEAFKRDEELAEVKAQYQRADDRWMEIGANYEKELAEAKREYQDACKLVAQMHHAATGSIQGPIRGVVEDVADVVETHRMQMAAISTACFSNSRSSEPPIDKTNPYWSVAYHDVVAAVKREMEQRDRAEQAEARALEYKTEHAALLGTSQWQEVEIADLRDDVKRLMQTVSECEERALAAEKDAGRLRWLLEDHEHPATRELRNSLLNRMQVMSYSAACTDIDAAIAGAKHETS